MTCCERDKGCVRGNCSYRHRPEKLYASYLLLTADDISHLRKAGQ